MIFDIKRSNKTVKLSSVIQIKNLIFFNVVVGGHIYISW